MTTILAKRFLFAASPSVRTASRQLLASSPLRCSSEVFARFYCSSHPVSLADATADGAADSVVVEERPFDSPRVENLFHRMKTLERDDLSTIFDLVYERLGIEITPEMFSGGGAVEAAGDGGAAEEETVEEKTAFDLKLVSFDSKAKIKVIKEVRAIAGLGLKEAKELVEGAPKVVKKDIKKEEAEELKAKLEEIGATVEIA